MCIGRSDERSQPIKMNKRRPLCSRVLVVAAFVGGIILLNAGPFTPTAQAFYGLTDISSPLVFIPHLQGELQVKPIWVRIESGQQTLPSVGTAWNLRNQFGLDETPLFVDIMCRFQISRFSLRIVYEIRDFVGKKKVVDRPDQPEAEARFSYTGIRLGGDFDIFQRYKTRVGMNMDYDLFPPIFNEAVQTIGGKKISGPAALTLGIHAVYNPITNFYGLSPVVEARVSWPILGTEVTDLELAIGVKAPETVLGSLALKGGYRRTNVEFKDRQMFNGVPVSTGFDAIMRGWFAELAYYY